MRPKGNLERKELSLLLLLAAFPLVMVVARILALPGAPSGVGLGSLREIGFALNENLSLHSAPPVEREHILYLLFLPTCALLIALARLTFGIRVLGFRSILIAVGFQESGVVPSLVLIAVVVATIVLVRPVLRRIRLPYYARVSVILGIAATILLGALLVGPWVRSEAVWRVAFFPVIVLGLLAEGIARTLDRDDVLMASWRASTTIVLAALIAMVCQLEFLRETVLQFPELVITQIVAIVLVSEFLDLRLFQDRISRLGGMTLPRLFSNHRAYRVAVVRNRWNTGIIGRLGRPGPREPRRRSVQRIVDALREGGHSVRVMEGDMTLLRELAAFLPPDPGTGQPGGIVFNLAHGIQGETQSAQVPAMLEMAGIGYTGPTPLGHALALDKVVAKILLHWLGVPTPAFCTMASPEDEVPDLRYPLVVKPRYESGYGLRVVQDREELEAAVAIAVRRYRQEALVEEYVAGRDIRVAVLGNEPPECLPLVELDAAKQEKLCPAPFDEALAQRIRELAIAAFRACECRDYARVDFRVSESNQPWVLEIELLGILEPGGSFALAAARAGYGFGDLVCRIVEVARERYLPAGAARPAGMRLGSHPGAERKASSGVAG